jgi:GDP-L-fucose synthase
VLVHAYECDLLDPGSAARFLREHHPDGVIHLAARVGGIGANRRHPGEFFFVNLAMGLHTEACRPEGTEKVLVLGSVCAYPAHPVPFKRRSSGYPRENAVRHREEGAARGSSPIARSTARAGSS